MYGSMPGNSDPMVNDPRRYGKPARTYVLILTSAPRNASAAGIAVAMVTIASSVDPSLINQPVTFTATVSAPGGELSFPQADAQILASGCRYRRALNRGACRSRRAWRRRRSGGKHG